MRAAPQANCAHRREADLLLRIPLPAGLDAAQQARHAVRQALRVWGIEAVADDAALGASELTANAVAHGAGPLELHLAVEHGPGDHSGVLCEVTDAGADMPRAIGGVSLSGESGRGLLIVAALARSMGVRSGHRSKTVWFRLDLPTACPKRYRITAGAAR